jgi:hypothetical protein
VLFGILFMGHWKFSLIMSFLFRHKLAFLKINITSLFSELNSSIGASWGWR